MCGIFGFVSGKESHLKTDQIKEIVENLAKLSEYRGKEAAGLALLANKKAQVFKSAECATKMLRSKDYNMFLNNCLENIGEEPVAALGHARLVTNGSQSQYHNNQPIVTDHCVGVHNGIVVNKSSIEIQHKDIEFKYEVDSEAIYRLIDKYSQLYNSIEAAINKTFQEIDGAATIALFCDKFNKLALATNTGSLYIASNESAQLFIFASEKYFLEEVLKLSLINRLPGPFSIIHIQAGRAVLVDLEDANVKTYSLEEEVQKNESIPRMEFSIIEKYATKSELRRCTKCVLPETFPMIEFDEDGVCNHCRDFEKQKEMGRDELEKLVEKYRSKDGSYDCIFAFSGGRDSSYGLHYLKNELGMNPLTFTYDWGMVTDLARRNIARMCGKLGVENIIRSPDIAKKRKNIRMNIEAWLKRPELGMIPLFMAGDKQFYRIAREIRKETGIKLVFFCAGNKLERTEFKTGFCGIKESAHGQRLWNYSIKNKLDLLWYYFKNFLVNPQYLNSSLLDTLSAYVSTYVEKDDFVYLYHYIPWDEKVISETLINKYSWEVAGDTDNTWRIGDGTAAFYNYIYHTVAGFSEHDTFRSNQIREGILTREEALKLLEKDNEPRYDSMRQYALTIGLNLEEALTIINRIPKLYDRQGRR